MLKFLPANGYLYAFLLTLFSNTTFATTLYSFGISINWHDSITVVDNNSVPTGIKEGTFSFDDLLTINSYLVDDHSIEESPQFPDVTFTLYLPETFSTLGCNISFVDNSPSPIYVYKWGNKLSMNFTQGYSAFHGDYKVLCF